MVLTERIGRDRIHRIIHGLAAEFKFAAVAEINCG